MLKLIRSQSTILMAILLAIISLSFIVYFNLPTIEGLTRSDLGRIRDHNVTADEFRLSQQDTLLWLRLSQGGQLPPGAAGSSEVSRLSWQRLVLAAEARRAGLAVSDAEVSEAIRAFPFLRKDGKYEPANYDLFVKNFLNPQGITADRFEESVRNDLLVNKLTQAVSSSASVTPAEIDRIIAIRLGAAHLQLVRLKTSDFVSQVPAPTAAEIEDAYKTYAQNPEWRTPIRRSVAWAFVPFDAGVDKLAEKEKAAAKRKTGEAAQALAEAALAAIDKDKTDAGALANAAAAQKAAAGTTPLFAQNETPNGLPPSPNLNRAAFALTTEVPISDPVETEKGYYVLQLLKADPGAQLPLDQVRPQIAKALAERAARKVLLDKGQAAAAAIKAAVATGKPFAEAAKEQKLSVETIPTFVPQDVLAGSGATIPDAQTLVPLSFSLQPGEVSQFFPTADGGLFVALAGRDAPDAKKAAALRPTVVQEQIERRKENILSDWLESVYKSKEYRLPNFVREQQ